MAEKKHQLIVVKIGSSSLTGEDGNIASTKIKNLVAQAAKIKDLGHQVILVTSGAIAAGFRRLGYQERPKTVPAMQAAAAVGQGLLIEEYTKHLLELGIVGAQLLLTREDFTDRRRYQNAFNALEVLLKKGVVPIINENDTVAIEELRFGDNDTLSAQVAALVHGDLLILLTDIDGLYTANPVKDPRAKRIDFIGEITPDIEEMADASESKVGVGGMKSKLSAAKLATLAGVPVFICSSKEENVLLKAIAGEAQGTYIKASANNLKTRLQWLAFYSDIKGTLIVDKGAADALKNQGKSLLPSGIVEVAGNFLAGDVVEVLDENKLYIGKGIAQYSNEDLQKIRGLSSAEIKRRLKESKTEAIHRDNWLGITKIRKGGI